PRPARRRRTPGLLDAAGPPACSTPPDPRPARRRRTPGLLDAAGRPRSVAPALAGAADGRAGACGCAVARDGAADAEKNAPKPHLREMWCIPPQQPAAFVFRMEDVPEVY